MEIGELETTHAAGSVEPRSWVERPYAEVQDAPRLTLIEGADRYHGEIEGVSTFVYVVRYQAGTTYRADGSPDPATARAVFMGLQRFVGALGGRSGSFVLETSGTVAGGVARADLSVSVGSGTADLLAISGTGELHHQHGGTSSIFLDYAFSSDT